MDKLKQAINNYEIFSEIKWFSTNGDYDDLKTFWRLEECLKLTENHKETMKARIIRDVKTTWSMSEREKIRAIGAYHYS